MNNKKEIPIWLNTLDAFMYDKSGAEYFSVLESLSSKGYTIVLYKDHINDSSPVKIESITHMHNFIKYYKGILHIKS